MHSPRLRAPRSFWPAAIVFALAIAACSTWRASPSAPTGLPDGIPIPADASVVVGQGGYDAGATLYGFSSDLAPAAALQGYEAQLTAAGFQRTGNNGPWQIYRHGTMQVAVRAGQSGPPTTLLVRVSTVPATAAGDASTTGQAGSPSRASGTGGTGSGRASGAGNGGVAPHASGNPNPGANGASNGNAKNRGNLTSISNGGGAPTAAPNGNAGGNPNPGSNAGGTGANGNPNPGADHSVTPVPQPPPPNGQPTTPPGQVGPTPPPGAARTPKP